MSGTVADLRSVRALNAGGVCHDLLGIPAIRELAHLNQWVCWRRESRNEKETKVPYTPSGKLASSTNPATWRSFDACAQAVEAGRFDGLGFVLVEGDGYGGLDLDDVIEPDGRVLDWAVAVVRLARSYTEVSPSGTGLRVIMRTADLPSGFKRTKHTGSIEAYTQGRYLTITGCVFNHQTVRHDTSGIADADLPTLAEHPLLAAPAPAAAPAQRTGGAAAPGSGRPEDDPRVASLIVHAGRSVPARTLSVYRDNHATFDAIFAKKGRPKKDASGSGYLMSIAGILTFMAVEPQTVADIMIEWCHEHDRPDLIVERTIRRTIGKVLQTRDQDGPEALRFDPEQCSQVLEEEVEHSDREEILEVLSAELGCPVEGFVKIGKAAPDYAIVINGQRVLLGKSAQLENASAVWRTIVETTDRAIPTFSKQRWLKILNLLLRIHTAEEADADFDADLIGAALEQVLSRGTIHKDEDYSIGLQEYRPIETADGDVGVPVTLVMQRLQTEGHRVPASMVREKLRNMGWARRTLFFRDGEGRGSSRSYYLTRAATRLRGQAEAM